MQLIAPMDAKVEVEARGDDQAAQQTAGAGSDARSDAEGTRRGLHPTNQTERGSHTRFRGRDWLGGRGGALVVGGRRRAEGERSLKVAPFRPSGCRCVLLVRWCAFLPTLCCTVPATDAFREPTLYERARTRRSAPLKATRPDRRPTSWTSTAGPVSHAAAGPREHRHALCHPQAVSKDSVVVEGSTHSTASLEPRAAVWRC